MRYTKCKLNLQIHKKCFIVAMALSKRWTSKINKIGPFILPILIMPFTWGAVLGLSDMNLSENISLAQCRASCLRMFTQKSQERDDRCHKDTDCYMCWNSCRMFQGNSPAKSTLCSDHTACFPGCQTACKFYEVSSPQNLTPPLVVPPAPLPAYMSSPKLTEGGRLIWEPPLWLKGSQRPPPDEVIMYIVMVEVGGAWNQHIQTTSPRAIIPDAIRDAGIRVLAVTSHGLVAFAERSAHGGAGTENPGDADLAVHASSPGDRVRILVDTTTLAIRKSSEEIEADELTIDTVNEAYREAVEQKYSYDYNPTGTDSLQPPSVTVDHSWEVSLQLLTYDLLASVEVSWEVRGSGKVDYMVTWAESAGGISGHLVTKQDRAEISLWSGQQYSLQVELLDHHGNTVLRSVPKTITFGADGLSESPLEDPEPSTTSPIPPKRISTPSLTYASTRADPSNPTWWREGPHTGVRKGGPFFTQNSTPLHNDKKADDLYPSSSQFPSTPERDSTPFLRNLTSPPWRPDPSLNEDVPGVSHKVEDNETHEKDGSSSLLAWAACLGVGAVVIVILIGLAVRTLRKNSTKRQEIHRAGEDFLSETTASSVNSSNITTCSRLTRGHRNEDEPWAYETFYGVANQPLNRIGTQRAPPPPLHAPPTPPLAIACPSLQPHHRQVGHFTPYTHSNNPVGQIATPLPSVRVDNASFIENYILALDPSPVDKRTHH